MLSQSAEARLVSLQAGPFDPNRTDRERVHTGTQTTTETYDELAMCVLVGNAKRLLGKSATLKEKFVLGCTRFYDDIAITHSNHKYFDKIYETKFNPKLCAKPKMEAQVVASAWTKWQHHVRVVPGMMLINGKNRTWFTGP